MKRAYLFGVFVLFLMSFVFADTPIVVKTYPNHDVNIFVLDSTTVYTSFESFLNKNSGDSGEVNVLSSVPNAVVDILLIVKKDGIVLYNKRFEDVSMSSEVNLVIPEALIVEEPLVNVTVNETESVNSTIEENVTEVVGTNVSSNESEQSASLTGNAISSFGGRYKNVAVFVVLGLIIIGGVSFMMIRKMRSPKKLPPGYNIPTVIQKSASTKSPASIEEIENRMADLQKELSKFRNKDKIDAAERKLEQDKKELERLKGEF